MSRRLSRSLPLIGAAIAVITVASAMRRKGVISGAIDSMLDAVPLVGAAKNVVEVARGRDFFPDRYGPGVNGVGRSERRKALAPEKNPPLAPFLRG